MKKAKIITISGIDGSGKTTLSSFIQNYLSKKYKIVYLHTNKDLIRKKSSSTIESNLNWLTAYLVAIKDWLKIILFIVANYFSNDYIICDRYIYDTLVKIRYRYKIIENLENILLKMTPTPLLSFFIEVPAKVSYQRDHDHDQKYHQKKGKVYFEFFKHLSKNFNNHIVKIDGNRDLKNIKQFLIDSLNKLTI